MILPPEHAFAGLPRNGFGTLYCDPPWRFEVWNGNTTVKARDSRSTCPSAAVHYETMSAQELSLLPVGDLAADDCALFMWVTWPTLEQALDLMKIWGFSYKTCGFSWMKAHATQIQLFDDEIEAGMGMGYWSRANNECCLLATKGKPKRLNADVRQGIIEPRRQHSRKPDCVHGRIERLVAGPYCELFARAPKAGWTVWGNQTSRFKEVAA